MKLFLIFGLLYKNVVEVTDHPKKKPDIWNFFYRIRGTDINEIIFTHETKKKKFFCIKGFVI